MRTWPLALVALAACRQALGIPSGGSVPGEEGFAITATVQGADGASDGAVVMLNDSVEPLGEGPFTFQTRLGDGEPYTITPVSGNCSVANGTGVIDGEDASGIEIQCDGLAAIKSLFSAPIDPLVASSETPAAIGSILTQETFLVPAPLHASARMTDLVFDGTQLTGSAPFGPFPFVPGRKITVGFDGSEFTRMYIVDPSIDVPTAYGFGKPSVLESGSSFGAALAMSGDTLVVGAPERGSGQAVVFHRVGREWVEDQVLTISGLPTGARFGASVAITTNKLVVGAPGGPTLAGAVYEFVQSGGTWMSSAPLAGTPTAAGDEFGAAVAITPTSTIVGAPGCNLAGCVFQFGATSQIYSDADPGDRFGASVAVSGNLLVVGAPGEDSAIAGDPTNNANPDAGAAYVYTLGSTTPTYLKAASPGTDDRFGTTVGIDGTLLVVGAPLEDSAIDPGGATDPEDNSANAAGAAYLFRFNGVWAQAAFIKAPNANEGDHFGRSVAILRNTVPGQPTTCVLAVGAPFEDSGTSSTDDESAPDAGAVFAFRVEVSNGQLGAPAYTKASSVGAGDAFGMALALTAETLVVGAPFEDSSVSGWNQLGNEGSLDAGAVFAVR